MNAEEKAAFDALNDSTGVYEELEDDFVFLANEGKAAIEMVTGEDEEEQKNESKSTKEKKKGGILKNNQKDAMLAEQDFRDRDIMIVEQEENEEMVALREYRERMAALLPPAGTNFGNVFEKQADLDANFDQFMDQEYDDAKMGEGSDEEIEPDTIISKQNFDNIVDDFIAEKKIRFPELHKQFGNVLPEELEKEYVPVDPSQRLVPHEEDLADGKNFEEVKAEMNAKKLAANAEFTERAEKAFLIEEANGWVEPTDEDPEDQWDAETILTTYTNTDNHPGVIKTQRRVRPKMNMKIELHKQFKVPLDGLIPLAEEIIV